MFRLKLWWLFKGIFLNIVSSLPLGNLNAISEGGTLYSHYTDLANTTATISTSSPWLHLWTVTRTKVNGANLSQICVRQR